MTTHRPPMDDPGALTKWLKATCLDSLPRRFVLDMFKTLDFRQDMIAATGTVEEHKAWMEPWTILINYIDPQCFIDFPLDSWDQVEEVLGRKVQPGQQELFA